MSDGIKLLQKNKKAFYNFDILETLECGIVLEGTEVKTLRQGKFSFGDAYVRIKNGELVLVGFHIAPYSFGSINNHEPDRDRILLASKQEIKKLRRKVEEKGNTLVPTKVYLKNSLIKVEVATARGRRMHDKRNAIRDRDLKRDAERSLKRY